ncbi:hypothetical protein Pmani_017497 [Petrolisthes manimaculis]|uniref:Uncharacterized protein n=1 Tax=Petrolisthes manimaculis TaxID=1843537 RepID=A0AAE1U5R5_9EUCA|nr:hypothetical protein Pmani_017497 [Petrolisthes manimaculis]
MCVQNPIPHTPPSNPFHSISSAAMNFVVALSSLVVVVVLVAASVSSKQLQQHPHYSWLSVSSGAAESANILNTDAELFTEALREKRNPDRKYKRGRRPWKRPIKKKKIIHVYHNHPPPGNPPPHSAAGGSNANMNALKNQISLQPVILMPGATLPPHLAAAKPPVPGN